MVIAIGGHPRSGTTLLKNLCSQHPAMVVSNEFHAFSRLTGTVIAYRKGLRLNWYKRPLVGRGGRWRFISKLESGAFILLYLSSFLGRGREPISIEMIERAYRRIFPSAMLVGDKYPRYVFTLERLVDYPNMKRVMIYRDPRDVARSVLEKVDIEWKGRRFTQRFDSAEKVAHSWVIAMENIRRFEPHIHAIKYEELVQEPERVLAALANYLGLDSAGFRSHMVKSDRVGKFQFGLPQEDIRTIESIASKWMHDYGYQ